MSREDNNFQIAGSLVFFGASFVISGVRRFRKSREVEDTAHIDISSAPQGLVEIQGFAWPCSNTIDTIRGRKAVYQKLVLEKLVRSGKSSSWVEAWSEIFDSNFYATDGTGFVKVDIRDAETEIRKKTTKWTALPQDIKDQLCNRIRTDHFPPTSGFFGTESSFRLCETVILLGAPVYLSGTLETAKVEVLQQTPGLQKFKNFIHKVGGKKIEKFLDFDANRDGVISEEEASVGSNRVGERATGTKTWDSMPPLPNVNFP